MRRIPVVALLAAGLVVSAAGAQEATWRFFEYAMELQWWWASLDSETSMGGTTDGRNLRFEDKFGLQTEEDIPHISLEVSPTAGHRIGFSYDTVEYAGGLVIPQQVLYDDTTFQAATQTQSQLDLRHAHLGYRYRFFDDIKWKSDVHLGVSLFSIDSEVRGTDALTGLPTMAGDRETTILPTFGLGALYQDEDWMENVTLHFVVWGMETRSQGSVLDGRAEAILELHRYVSVAAGYRISALKARAGDDRTDLVIGGPFVSLLLSY